METIIGQPNHGAAAAVKDVTIETFEEDVIKASMDQPVIVDFWAEWCGPCKQLAPVLEMAVSSTAGKVSLVKIDIDKNQMLAGQLRIQSIPTIYAFYQGRPVDGFQGALPESEIKAFVDRLIQLTGASEDGPAPEEILELADNAFAAGDITGAAQTFAALAQSDPQNVAAIAGLARCQLALGEAEKARQTLELVPPEKRTDQVYLSAKAALELSDGSPVAGDIDELQMRAASNPGNLDARFEYASALITSGGLEKAIDELLGIIERDREWNDAAPRKKLLTVFDALGGAHPATIRGRRRLSSVLFS